MLDRDATGVPALAAMKSWLTGDRTQPWLAEKLGVSRPTVYRWCSGEHAPDACYRRAMQDLSRGVVNVDDWFTDEQLEMAYRFAKSKALSERRKNMVTK